MKHFLTSIGLAVLLAACGSSKNISNDLAVSTPIVTTINLTAVTNDKVPVTIDPGRFTEETVTYYLPKVVQGTYSVSAFGRFVEDFKALDYNGNPLQFTHPEENTWVISNAKKLDKIVYQVNDTFDQEVEGGIGGDMPFSPAGTNIEEKNYVLNLHGFIGYFDALKNNQYTLDVAAPAIFKHSSALQVTANTPHADGSVTHSYLAPRYFDITDNPMMYGDMSIEEFMVGDIKVVLSVYSPNSVHSAAELKPSMYKMMEGQKAYLGAINSTPRYDIFLYLADATEDAPKGFGALEHHTSTVVVLQEAMPIDALEKAMIDIVAHEFFHIVTPLSVHSEDVHYFDYNNPTFSKHLWMYEGVTEYFAQHFQISEGLMTNEEFYAQLMEKIKMSSYFDDRMSFTEMSENILEAPYAENYINVYSKGALIGMCIDILMREESNGQRSMLSLMKELSTRYGTNKPFSDDALITEISAMTYPSVAEFLKTHVEGTTPIDYHLFFNKVGLTMGDKKVETSYIQDGTGFIFSGDQEKMTLFFSENVVNNSFWTEEGVLPGDVIKEVGGTVLTLQNAQSLIGAMYQWQPGSAYEIKVERDGKELIFKGELRQAFTFSKTLIEDKNASSAQKALRQAWLKG
ncbi:M61 family metallopeptidase [Gelidibacter salicanalis]|uniref:Peptidase M61 n=1 Tax=Gelidibacter salicanalis TaxID=291193 RepID=A0A934KR15_9FLAO|nr:peptidase M61 [Gelidibacter salicanalis]MBJ7879866.1 peptidase M61 [Gelidibacter salicanalis]